jgi:hypothetical protein
VERRSIGFCVAFLFFFLVRGHHHHCPANTNGGRAPLLTSILSAVADMGA